MPTQKIPAAPVVGGVTSRRHAKLLHHLFDASNGGASANAPVKDLRIRRVVPPASAPPPDASPDPPAAAKPVTAVFEIQVAQSTPPEPTAAAAQDRERKQVSLIYSPPSFIPRASVKIYSRFPYLTSFLNGSPGAAAIQASAQPGLLRLPAPPAVPEPDGGKERYHPPSSSSSPTPEYLFALSTD
jgi:hypothetical protein